MKKFLFLLISLFLLSFSLASSFDPPLNPEQPTVISSCRKIEVAGTYKLESMISPEASKGDADFKCIEITVPDVILDCDDNSIIGNSVEMTYPKYAKIGIYSDQENTTVKNCKISAWDHGIVYAGAHKGRIENNTVTSNGMGITLVKSGITFLTSNENHVLDNELYDNNYGIGIYGDNNLIEGNTIEKNVDGITTVITIGQFSYPGKMNNNEIINNKIRLNKGNGIYLEGKSNTIKDNVIELNSENGIYFWSSTTRSTERNLIYNNLFNNRKNFGHGEVGLYENFWNVYLRELTEGTNIIGGKYLGGNFWGHPDERGFSDECIDEEYGDDCICDESYDLTGNGKNVDNYPLTYWCDCPDQCCYTDENGEYVVSVKDAYGSYTCDEVDYERCSYSKKIEMCRIDAEDTDRKYFGNILIRGDYKVGGACIDYIGCEDIKDTSGKVISGQCANPVLNSDYCSLNKDAPIDLNNDRWINILDLTIIAKAFGSHGPDIPNQGDSPSEEWDPLADVNNDRIINILDLTAVAKHFGKPVTYESGLLIEYYALNEQSAIGSDECITEIIDCSRIFGAGPLKGAEWDCVENKEGIGACVGCESDQDCYELIDNSGYKDVGTGFEPLELGEECVVETCSKNLCKGGGYVREWSCDLDENSDLKNNCIYTDYNGANRIKCEVDVEKGKICNPDSLGEIDASWDLSCQPEDELQPHKPQPYCPYSEANPCYGDWHYSECDGYGNCDEDADEYYQSERVNAKEGGYVLDVNCQSVDGTCFKDWKCYSTCQKAERLWTCAYGLCSITEWNLESVTDCKSIYAPKNSEAVLLCQNDECTNICEYDCGGDSGCDGLSIPVGDKEGDKCEQDGEEYDYRSCPQGEGFCQNSGWCRYTTTGASCRRRCTETCKCTCTPSCPTSCNNCDTRCVECCSSADCGTNTDSCPSDGCSGSGGWCDYPPSDSCPKPCVGNSCGSCTPSCTPSCNSCDTRCVECCSDGDCPPGSSCSGGSCSEPD